MVANEAAWAGTNSRRLMSGLAGMRERVRACGGLLTAGPVVGGGWQVLARLPARLG
jgi:signal transduction histidine kinase